MATNVRTQSPKKAVFTRTSDGGGNATETTPFDVRGRVVGVKCIPGTGADQPDENYDVTVDDSDGLDVLRGVGQNRTNAAGGDYAPVDYVLSDGARLVGGAASRRDRAAIRSSVLAHPRVEQVGRLLTMHLGPTEILVNVDVDLVDGRTVCAGDGICSH